MPATPYTYGVIADLFTKSWLALEVDGKEISGAGYERQPIAWGVKAEEGMTLTNAAAITFPKAKADWGKVAGLCICDAPKGGNEIWELPAKVAKLVYAGDRPTFEPGVIQIEMK